MSNGVASLLVKSIRKQVEQGKSEGFDSCHRPSNLTKIWLKSILPPVWTWNLMDDHEK